MAHPAPCPAPLPPRARAVAGIAFWLRWVWLCHVPISACTTGASACVVPSTFNATGCLWAHATWRPKTWTEAGPTEQQGRLWAYFSFLDKYREGRRLFFSLTCLPVVSINKFGHVLRLPLQLLNAERNQTTKAFELSHHSHFTHTSKSSVCGAGQHDSLFIQSLC